MRTPFRHFFWTIFQLDILNKNRVAGNNNWQIYNSSILAKTLTAAQDRYKGTPLIDRAAVVQGPHLSPVSPDADPERLEDAVERLDAVRCRRLGEGGQRQGRDGAHLLLVIHQTCGVNKTAVTACSATPPTPHPLCPLPPLSQRQGRDGAHLLLVVHQTCGVNKTAVTACSAAPPYTTPPPPLTPSLPAPGPWWCAPSAGHPPDLWGKQDGSHRLLCRAPLHHTPSAPYPHSPSAGAVMVRTFCWSSTRPVG